MNTSNETTNAWETLQTLAKGVADIMGYKVKPRSESNHGGYAVIEGPDGRAIAFNTASGLANSGKIHISGVYPDRIDGRLVWTARKTYPRIQVAMSKSPAIVARDIERRLMPDYLALLAECKETIARWTDIRDKSGTIANMIATEFGAQVRKRDNPTADAEISLYGSRDLPEETAHVHVSSGSVTFDRLTVSPSVAFAILRLLKKQRA
jgi:hypothetical protein